MHCDSGTALCLQTRDGRDFFVTDLTSHDSSNDVTLRLSAFLCSAERAAVADISLEVRSTNITQPLNFLTAKILKVTNNAHTDTVTVISASRTHFDASAQG